MKTDLKEKASFVNEILGRYLPKDTKEFGNITEAMNYSVLAGGKRLRGIMLLESFRLFNNDSTMEEMLAYPFAAAIEFIHAYSLVHDDLPSMDNDMYRRGMLTTHAKYGHAMGVLTGDALLNYAFETMSKAITGLGELRSEFVPELYRRAAQAMHFVSTKAGYSGMIGGQVLDVCILPDKYAAHEDNTYTQMLLKTYELKTSDLFRAALCAGAILGGASDEDINRLDRFGYELGLAFQIKDDVLDKTSTYEKLGKDINSDEKNSKSTVVTIYGLNKAEQMVSEKLNTALNILEELPGNTEFFKDLVGFLNDRES